MQFIVGIVTALILATSSGCASPSSSHSVEEILVPHDTMGMSMLVVECRLFLLFCRVRNGSELSPQSPPYQVWYATNRKPIQLNNPAGGFSDLRDEQLHYGMAEVRVPKSHKFGSVGSSWIRRKMTLSDDRLTVGYLLPLDKKRFLKYVDSKLRLPGKRKALLYIHGYNVTFEEAILRAAQMGYDLKVEGITAMYSWPSKGAFFSYTADEATVESSAGFLKEFLDKISQVPTIEEIDVIAHSMGSRAFLRAVEAMAPAMKKANKRFGQIILAAPDVDVDVFKNIAAVFPKISLRTTVYVSAKDLAVTTSELLHQYPRVGLYPPLTIVPGIDTIQVSNIDLTLIGHSYYAEAEAVLYDMFNLLQDNQAPYQRIRLIPHPSGAKPTYWEIGQ